MNDTSTARNDKEWYNVKSCLHLSNKQTTRKFCSFISYNKLNLSHSNEIYLIEHIWFTAGVYRSSLKFSLWFKVGNSSWSKGKANFKLICDYILKPSARRRYEDLTSGADARTWYSLSDFFVISSIYSCDGLKYAVDKYNLSVARVEIRNRCIAFVSVSMLNEPICISGYIHVSGESQQFLL